MKRISNASFLAEHYFSEKSAEPLEKWLSAAFVELCLTREQKGQRHPMMPYITPIGEPEEEPRFLWCATRTQPPTYGRPTNTLS